MSKHSVWFAMNMSILSHHMSDGYAWSAYIQMIDWDFEQPEDGTVLNKQYNSYLDMVCTCESSGQCTGVEYSCGTNRFVQNYDINDFTQLKGNYFKNIDTTCDTSSWKSNKNHIVINTTSQDY